MWPEIVSYLRVHLYKQNYQLIFLNVVVTIAFYASPDTKYMNTNFLKVSPLCGKISWCQVGAQKIKVATCQKLCKSRYKTFSRPIHFFYYFFTLLQTFCQRLLMHIQLRKFLSVSLCFYVVFSLLIFRIFDLP